MSHTTSADGCFEPLEPRVLLAYTDFPSIGDMDDPNNTVVRLATSEGFIDLEMLDDGAPGTVANFLQLVTAGIYDDSFFHRNVSNFVVQGGGFGFTDVGGLTDLPDFGTVDNEFDPSRSNVAGTVAMAKVGGDPNSATNQFFFNIGDNSANLDTQNGGFTVFARILDGMDVANTINGLTTQTFVDPLDPLTSALGQVPVTGAGTELAEDILVRIIDAEIIKPGDTNEFFDDVVVYPEGWRGSTIVENVELVNPNPVDAVYQMIVRYEVGDRDEVISSGTIPANESMIVPISDFQDAGLDLVREGVGFGFEIQTSVPGATSNPVSANFHHVDFGGTVVESFASLRELADADLQTWDFGLLDVDSATRPFIVWMNLTDQPTTVTTTFYSRIGGPITVNSTLEPWRRGGLNLTDLGLTDASYSARVESTTPIAAAMSRYTAPGGASTPAWGSLGIPSGGDSHGAIAGVAVANGAETTLSVLNTSTAGAIVRVDLIRTGMTPSIAHTFVVPPESRDDLDLSSLISAGGGSGPDFDEVFSLRYVSQTGADVGVQLTGFRNGDGFSTPVATFAASAHHFAAGFQDADRIGDGSRVETISVFNPFTLPGVASEVTFRVDFRFNDGEIITTGNTFTFQGQERIDVNVADLPDVVTKIETNDQFQEYSISVVTDGVFSILAQLTTFDTQTGVAFTTIGEQILDVTAMSDPNLLGSL